MKRWIVIVTVCLTGCHASERWAKAEVEHIEQHVPASWDAHVSLPQRSSSTSSQSLNDPVLSQLIEMAHRHNPDKKSILQKIHKAQAQKQLARAAFVPTLSAEGNYSHKNTSKLLNLGLSASFSANPWGLEGANRAATIDEEYASFQYQDFLMTLNKEVAKEYFTLVQSQNSRQLAEEKNELLRRREQLLYSKQRSGLLEVYDLSQARSEQEATQQEWQKAEQEAYASRQRLASWVGVSADQLPVALPSAISLPHGIPETTVGELPLQILRQRPDVRAADAQVRYQAALKDVALSDYLPSLQLSYFFGKVAMAYPAASGFSVKELAASVLAPLIDFGKVRAKVAMQDAEARMALAAYEKTVIHALAQIHMAWDGERRTHEIWLHAQEAEKQQAQRCAIVRDRVKAGLASEEEWLREAVSVKETQRLQWAAELHYLHQCLELHYLIGRDVHTSLK